nr:hypothetical protein [Tanacetum cinerariifolium]
ASGRDEFDADDDEDTDEGDEVDRVCTDMLVRVTKSVRRPPPDPLDPKPEDELMD